MSGGGPSEAQIRSDMCAKRREERTEGYSAFFERCRRNTSKGKRQERCGLCGIWCWPEDRCDAFYTAAAGKTAANANEGESK